MNSHIECIIILQSDNMGLVCIVNNWDETKQKALHLFKDKKDYLDANKLWLNINKTFSNHMGYFPMNLICILKGKLLKKLSKVFRNWSTATLELLNSSYCAIEKIYDLHFRLSNFLINLFMIMYGLYYSCLWYVIFKLHIILYIITLYVDIL